MIVVPSLLLLLLLLVVVPGQDPNGSSCNHESVLLLLVCTTVVAVLSSCAGAAAWSGSNRNLQSRTSSSPVHAVSWILCMQESPSCKLLRTLQRLRRFPGRVLRAAASIQGEQRERGPFSWTATPAMKTGASGCASCEGSM